ncbi:MAG: peptidase [Cyclobacteriaceae bacterium]|nr:peptidase [Cyclobacteriaceae bacterium]
MKKGLFFGAFSLLLTMAAYSQTPNLRYSINLNDRENDTFKVTLEVDKLSDENNVYQFASTAPGTYQTMNLGRFVSNFKVFDKKGREIETENISVNQWKISTPKKAKKITYVIAETWDTPVEEYPVYKMCGTSMEDDHVLMNAHCIFGFPSGMQSAPLSINLSYPENWKVGTALNKNESGDFYAKSYDHAVDSPILLGRLTKATTDLNGSSIEIYTYSKTDLVTSEQLLSSMSSMLTAASEFMIEFPVDRYAFLYHFEDESWGAWEHSYSSEYVMKEQEYSGEFKQGVIDMAAHEFFHVVTPLNIHSELIEKFNFVTPTPSEHLWLYEGTTEWAAHMMQLRNGLITLDQYLTVLQKKLITDSYFDPAYSLSKLALTSFSKEGQQQYGNIYMRGALVAGLLDIRLLELSGGKKGYREVIYELSKKYGPNNAFSEKDFFTEFVAFTYPEIGDFFDKYVKNANPLPMDEYYSKLGIEFTPEVKNGQLVADLGGHLAVPDGKIRYVKIRPELEKLGLKVNDELIGINGEELSLSNANQLIGGLMQKDIDYEYEVTIRRGEEELTIPLKLLSKEKVSKFVFEVDESATEEQKTFREVWMKNM